VRYREGVGPVGPAYSGPVLGGPAATSPCRTRHPRRHGYRGRPQKQGQPAGGTWGRPAAAWPHGYAESGRRACRQGGVEEGPLHSASACGPAPWEAPAGASWPGRGPHRGCSSSASGPPTIWRVTSAAGPCPSKHAPVEGVRKGRCKGCACKTNRAPGSEWLRYFVHQDSTINKYPIVAHCPMLGGWLAAALRTQ
jgi:hypothetical protein